ncbi:MAG: hypothetical protein KDI73_01510 [Candidatus Competibacteraceae bacterium]|nr:hypothetical protein [Candidatus Competibacteraceae bacterium]
MATKPALARALIERAMAAKVPFRWVAADSVHGVGAIEMALKRAGIGDVLGVGSSMASRCGANLVPSAARRKVSPRDWPLRTGSGSRRGNAHQDHAGMTGPIWSWPILR